MKIKYVKSQRENFLLENNRIDLLHGNVYVVVEETKRWYRIKDESGEVYAYPKSFFEIVEE